MSARVREDHNVDHTIQKVDWRVGLALARAPISVYKITENTSLARDLARGQTGAWTSQYETTPMPT